MVDVRRYAVPADEREEGKMEVPGMYVSGFRVFGQKPDLVPKRREIL